MISAATAHVSLFSSTIKPRRTRTHVRQCRLPISQHLTGVITLSSARRMMHVVVACTVPWSPTCRSFFGRVVVKNEISCNFNLCAHPPQTSYARRKAQVAFVGEQTCITPQQLAALLLLRLRVQVAKDRFLLVWVYLYPPAHPYLKKEKQQHDACVWGILQRVNNTCSKAAHPSLLAC